MTLDKVSDYHYIIHQGESPRYWTTVYAFDPKDEAWRYVTPDLLPDDAYSEMQRLQESHPDVRYMLKSTNTTKCWYVMLEHQLDPGIQVSPCYDDYGNAYATYMALKNGEPLPSVPAAPEQPQSVPTYKTVYVTTYDSELVVVPDSYFDNDLWPDLDSTPIYPWDLDLRDYDQVYYVDDSLGIPPRRPL